MEIKLLPARTDAPVTAPLALPELSANAAAVRGLVYDAAVKARTDALYAHVAHVIPAIEWPLFAPLIDRINQLKVEKDAVILAHNYMTPEIYACVGDFRGDSLALARYAQNVPQQVIVQAGVHFMAETSKILAPEKTVLIPDTTAGCSLAASITGDDVRLIKQKYPGLPVVTYVNTTADVKAESDICCTSSNAVQVVEWAAQHFGTDAVIMLPDRFLAQNVAAQTGIKIIAWQGSCYVHEQFSAQDVADIRKGYPDAVVLAHPECPNDVVQASDFTGSTGAMVDYVKQEKPAKVVLITECSMSDNVAIENPDVTFVRPCNLCKYMKTITLAAIHDALVEGKNVVDLPADMIAKARKAVDAMLALPPQSANIYDTGKNVPASMELIAK